MRALSAAVPVLVALTLAGCGGGESSPATTPTAADATDSSASEPTPSETATTSGVERPEHYLVTCGEGGTTFYAEDGTPLDATTTDPTRVEGFFPTTDYLTDHGCSDLSYSEDYSTVLGLVASEDGLVREPATVDLATGVVSALDGELPVGEGDAFAPATLETYLDTGYGEGGVWSILTSDGGDFLVEGPDGTRYPGPVTEEAGRRSPTLESSTAYPYPVFLLGDGETFTTLDEATGTYTRPVDFSALVAAADAFVVPESEYDVTSSAVSADGSRVAFVGTRGSSGPNALLVGVATDGVTDVSTVSVVGELGASDEVVAYE